MNKSSVFIFFFWISTNAMAKPPGGIWEDGRFVGLLRSSSLEKSSDKSCEISVSSVRTRFSWNPWRFGTVLSSLTVNGSFLDNVATKLDCSGGVDRGFRCTGMPSRNQTVMLNPDIVKYRSNGKFTYKGPSIWLSERRKNGNTSSWDILRACEDLRRLENF